MSETFLNGRVVLHSGDCLTVMETLAENSLDACLCDPPYHLASIVKRFGKTGSAPVKVGDINESNNLKAAFARQSAGFMGKQWDGGDIAFQVSTWEKVYRVLKPGAYILAFSSSRTFGRMSVAIEDAGFITHPLIGWIFGQGFPKAHRVHIEGMEGFRYGGQALKPALEPIYVGQKPFSEINGTANIKRWGTGALNIDACRVPHETVNGGNLADNPHLRTSINGGNGGKIFPAESERRVVTPHAQGRWPANVMTDGSPEVFAAFPVTSSGEFLPHHQAKGKSQIGTFDIRDRTGETHPTYGDAGSAARFFWSSKAVADDRLGSKHPTVKPVDLMQELARLITPVGGTILDCFAGTGTTAEAAFREGFNAVLIEREAEYQADIRRRMALCMSGPDERKRESIKAKIGDLPFEPGSLFAPLSAEAGG